jgi:hypothetical protein
MSCFSFYLFPHTKTQKRRAEKVLPRVEGWHQWERGSVGARV